MVLDSNHVRHLDEVRRRAGLLAARNPAEYGHAHSWVLNETSRRAQPALAKAAEYNAGSPEPREPFDRQFFESLIESIELDNMVQELAFAPPEVARHLAEWWKVLALCLYATDLKADSELPQPDLADPLNPPRRFRADFLDNESRQPRWRPAPAINCVLLQMERAVAALEYHEKTQQIAEQRRRRAERRRRERKDPLTDPQRSAWNAYHQHGSYAAAAKALGKHESTVRKQVERAAEKLGQPLAKPKRTHRLPRDHNDQVHLAHEDDRRDRADPG